MSSVILNRRKHRSSPPQPLDRHLSEISESDGTIYINAGIDSTCCKKPTRTIHKLTNGIVVSTVTPTIESRNSNEHNDDLSPVRLNHRTDADRCYSMNNVGCIHCGK